MIHYPVRCTKCENISVAPTEIPYRVTHIHDGVEHDIEIPNLPVLKCQNCGRVLYIDKTDAMISDAIRKAANLLSPVEIRRIREQAGWTIEKMAEVMGVDPETVEFWEISVMYPTHAQNDELRRLSVFGGVAEANG